VRVSLAPLFILQCFTESAGRLFLAPLSLDPVGSENLFQSLRIAPVLGGRVHGSLQRDARRRVTSGKAPLA